MTAVARYFRMAVKTTSSIWILLICVLFTSACGGEKAVDTRIRVIIDADANNEVDDQHAIAYTLFNGDVFDLAGITVNRTRNGGDILKHCEEAERVVTLCGLQSQVNVYKGADGNFKEIASHVNDAHFDGEEAVNFIIEQAHANDDRQLVLIPVGKLTNIALALKKDPSIAAKVRIVWLGSNMPVNPGEYNFDNDTASVNYVLESDVIFEVSVVRNSEHSGTEAVKVSTKEMQANMPGKGPQISTAIEGRSGGTFTNFGDYAVDLFEKTKNEHRSLFDVCAVALVKNPGWAERVEMSAPTWVNDAWKAQPENERKIIIWENYDKQGIIADFFNTMENYVLVK